MNYKNIGFQLANVGLMQEVADEIRDDHPSWNDKKVVKETQKVLKKATLFHDFNKKAKKPKKEKEPNPKKPKKPKSKIKKGRS